MHKCNFCCNKALLDSDNIHKAEVLFDAKSEFLHVDDKLQSVNSKFDHKVTRIDVWVGVKVVLYDGSSDTTVQGGTGLPDLTHHVTWQGGQVGAYLSQVLGTHWNGTYG